MRKPFAITLDPGSSLANRTGTWRTERPLYVRTPAPCGGACPAGEDPQAWLYHAEEGDYETALAVLERAAAIGSRPAIRRARRARTFRAGSRTPSPATTKPPGACLRRTTRCPR